MAQAREGTAGRVGFVDAEAAGMVETIVTIHRGDVLAGAAVGAVCGVVIGCLGPLGLGLTAPTLLLAGLVAWPGLTQREVSMGTLGFTSACAGLICALS